MWNELPAELLLSILREVRHCPDWKASYSQCLLVCKSWNKITLMPLYQCLVIHNKEGTSRLIACLKINGLGCLVENLIINSTYFERQNADDFTSVAQLCPNVLSISCCGVSSAHKWTVLIESIVHFKKLHTLPWPQEDELEAYTSCALYCCALLKTLHIPGDLPESENGKRATARLELFPNLSSLVIRNVRTARLADFDAMLNLRPRLRTLDIRMEDSTGQNEAHFEEHSLSSVRPHPGIQELSVDSNCEPLLFEYIMRKMPHLRRLNCNVKFESHLASRDRLNRYLLANMNRFLSYLGQVPSYDVKFYNSLRILPEMIRNTEHKRLHVHVTNFIVDQGRWDKEYHQLHITNKSVNVKYRDCSRHDLAILWKSVLDDIRHLNISTFLTNMDDAHSAMIDALFYCKNIKSITLSSCDSLDIPTAFSDRSINNSSLEMLGLKAEEIHKDIYVFYSKHFSSLKYVTIDRMIRFDEIKRLEIDMSDTRFETLNVSVKTIGMFRVVDLVLKIKSRASSQKVYLFGHNNHSCEIEKYEEVENTFTLDIHCRSIERLLLSINGRFLNLNHLSLL